MFDYFSWLQNATAVIMWYIRCYGGVSILMGKGNNHTGQVMEEMPPHLGNPEMVVMAGEFVLR